MTQWLSLGAVVAVCVLTLAVGSWGLRWSRPTSDFYVAGRTVRPWRNASAICGEYLSAASFLGVAALVYERGVDLLWLPVGYTVGYVVLLVLVAAPLRRSGAYTLADFAQMRLDSQFVRRLAAVLVVAIGWLYLLPQFQGAGLALTHLTGWPTWVGGLVVAVVVLANVASGGMRSITAVQAMQYWLKLTAISVPVCILLAYWWLQGRPGMTPPDPGWAGSLWGLGEYGHPVYATWSTLVALALGAMGLPHILVRFYTNPDGTDARRTTVAVIALLGVFYLFPPLWAVLARVYLDPAPSAVSTDAVVLGLPGAAFAGVPAHALTAVVAGGAFAAFLSTASGLAMSVTGALHHDLWEARGSTGSQPLRGFRLAALAALGAPYLLSLLLPSVGLATTVTLAFAVAAATFAPLLVLGIWWRGLSRTGAVAGLLTGGITATTAVVITMFQRDLSGWPGALLSQPAAWCTPLTFAVMVIVSLATPGSVPARTVGVLMRLHTPEQVGVSAR
ncbi:cation/acetate symporter [Branchiibius hedensis]|uniref:Cation/acetate symporter n=1 Tax=Branchiibius hedensis TaxID=672460 RepID=A0A2Y8ZMS5_9MICO|nr:cation acetate symporter [Branchiibius hedensis]PWJ24277.1 cation/acetate symporter [Branchiibius hedensis]SSA33094.1 cation/acetate symporter [Branchiibius hedensis]